MTSVVVGVDGSGESALAVRWAAMFARAFGVPLRAVRVWQYPADLVLTVGRVELPDVHEADARIEGELRGDVLAALGDVPEGAAVDVDLVVGHGRAASAILRAAGDRPRLIVVGSRGRGGFDGVRLGSVSRQLCEHARSPVTVVPRTVAADPPRIATIVVGADGSPGSEHAVAFAGDLAAQLDAKVVAVHAAGPGYVIDPWDAGRPVELLERRVGVDDWCGPLRAAGVDYQVAAVAGDPRTALLDLAADRSADLVVVGSRGHGVVTQLLLGSVATSLAGEATVPVTIVPPPR